MKINVEIVSLTFLAEAADVCSPSPTLFLGRNSVADIEPYSDQRHWWLWDIIASKALCHLLMLFPADPRPQPVSTQHIFPLRTGRVCIPGFLFLKAAVTSPGTARRHEAEASGKELRRATVPVRPQSCTSGRGEHLLGRHKGIRRFVGLQWESHSSAPTSQLCLTTYSPDLPVWYLHIWRVRQKLFL